MIFHKRTFRWSFIHQRMYMIGNVSDVGGQMEEYKNICGLIPENIKIIFLKGCVLTSCQNC